MNKSLLTLAKLSAIVLISITGLYISPNTAAALSPPLPLPLEYKFALDAPTIPENISISLNQSPSFSATTINILNNGTEPLYILRTPTDARLPEWPAGYTPLYKFSVGKMSTRNEASSAFDSPTSIQPVKTSPSFFKTAPRPESNFLVTIKAYYQGDFLTISGTAEPTTESLAARKKQREDFIETSRQWARDNRGHLGPIIRRNLLDIGRIAIIPIIAILLSWFAIKLLRRKKK